MFSSCPSKGSPDPILAQIPVAVTNVNAVSSHRKCLHLKTTLHSLPSFVTDDEEHNITKERNCSA